MSFIKLTTAAFSLAMFATTAGAGSLVVPDAMPTVEIVEEEAGSGAMLLPLAALVLIAAAIGSSSSDGTAD